MDLLSRVSCGSLTFFRFLCSDLVDYEQGRQVRADGAASLGRSWQRYPHVLQPLPQFGLLKELLWGGRNTQNSTSKWRY